MFVVHVFVVVCIHLFVCIYVLVLEFVLVQAWSRSELCLCRAGPGAEVTGGNWCDDHVWPPLPPCTTTTTHVPQTWNTPLHHNHSNHAPLVCVANAWNRADSGAQWRSQSPESRRELSEPLLCRQTVRSGITFTLQDILILYEAQNCQRLKANSAVTH